MTRGHTEIHPKITINRIIFQSTKRCHPNSIRNIKNIPQSKEGISKRRKHAVTTVVQSSPEQLSRNCWATSGMSVGTSGDRLRMASWAQADGSHVTGRLGYAPPPVYCLPPEVQPNGPKGRFKGGGQLQGWALWSTQHSLPKIPLVYCATKGRLGNPLHVVCPSQAQPNGPSGPFKGGVNVGDHT